MGVLSGDLGRVLGTATVVASSVSFDTFPLVMVRMYGAALHRFGHCWATARLANAGACAISIRMGIHCTGGAWRGRLWLGWPLAPMEFARIALLMFTLSYVLAGMVLYIRQLLGIDLAIGSLTTLAYVLGSSIAPNYAWLWQALLQGGGLIDCGIYALRRGAS